MFCPSCGKDNPDDARFCRGCGNPLSAPVQPEILPDPDPVTETGPVIPDITDFNYSSVAEAAPAVEIEPAADTNAAAAEEEPLFTPVFNIPGEAQVGSSVAEPQSEVWSPDHRIPDGDPIGFQNDYEEPAAPTGQVCPVCGNALASGAKFCNKCGASISSEPAHVPPPVKPVSHVIPSSKKKIPGLIIGICAAAVIVALVLVLVFSGGSGNGYDKISGNYYFNFTEDEELQIYSEKGNICTLDCCDYELRCSLDRTVYTIDACDDDYEHELYYFDGSKAVCVSDDFDEYILSADGSVLAYTICTDEDEYEYDLCIYKNGKSEKIVSEVNGVYGISPNGKYIGYIADYDEDDDTFKGYYYNGSKSVELGKNAVPLAFSDNGKYIYYIDYDPDDYEETLYVQTGSKGDDREKLGKDVDYLYFNSDFTELLFHCDGKTYLSQEGDEAEKLSSEKLYLCLPDDAQSSYSDLYCSCRIYGVDTFEGLYYMDYSDRLYYLKDEDELEKIASKVDWAVVADDNKTVYFLKDNGDMCRIDGTKKNPEAVDIAEDVDDFVISLDGKILYYVTEDEELYSFKGKKATRIYDDFGDYLYSVIDGNLYFASDDELYCSKNGAKAESIKELSDDVEDVGGCYRYVLVSCEDEVWYLSFDGKNFSEIDN